MRGGVRESSIESHHTNEALLINQGKAERILEWTRRHGGWVTRRQISIGTGIETATVSGRVNALVASGDLIECEEHEKRPCPITGRSVTWVIHKDNAPGQRSLPI